VLQRLGSARRRLVRMAVALPLVCSVSSGCSKADEEGRVVDQVRNSEDQTRTTVDQTGTLAADSTAAVPSDEISFGVVALQSYAAEDEELIWSATQLLIADCMAVKGYEYSAIPPEDVRGNRQLAAMVDHLDATIAASAGYHANAIALDASVEKALLAHNVAAAANDARAVDDPSFTVALEGAEGGEGCIRDAYDALYAGRTPMPELFRELIGPIVSEIYQRVASDAAVRGALAAWSTCMSVAGMQYSTPVQARAAFALAESVTAQEIAVATRDSQCREEVDLITTQTRAEWKYLQRWLEMNPGVFEQLADARAADVAAAKSVLEL